MSLFSRVALLVTVVALMPASMMGAEIPITNPGFEAFVLADGSYTEQFFTGNGGGTEIVSSDPIPGWLVTGPAVCGTSNLVASQLPGGVPEGENVVYCSAYAGHSMPTGMISQVLTETLHVDTTYVLTVYVGTQIAPQQLLPYAVQLVAGGVVLAADNNSLSPPLGTLEKTTVSYTARAGDGQLGLPLEIRLVSLGGSGTYPHNLVNFDDVHLTSNALCGNGIVDPGEQCDLGSANCLPTQYCSSGCTSDCKVIGSCTGNQAACTTAAECPSGQGCCGNDVVESGEQCDDGNLQNDDCCSSTCQIENSCVPLPDVCTGTFGPHLISNPTVKKTQLSQSRTSTGGLDTWSTNGQFSLNDGQAIDPDTEIVVYVLSQNNGSNQSTNLYAPVLDPAKCPNGVCFVPTTNPQGLDLRWTFKRKSKDPDISGAPGWRSGKFSRTAKQTNLIHFSLSGKNTTIGTPQSLSSIRRVRQSIKIGDDCITRLIDCAPNNARTRFTCKEKHCGNGIKDRGETCGEPTLPSCAAGKVCDTCVCVTGP